MNDEHEPPPWACGQWGQYEHDWLDCPECLEAYERYLELDDAPPEGVIEMTNDRSKHCATCGKPRGPLEQRRESWGMNMPTVLIPRRDDVDGKPWQQTNDLIVNAGVWRNGGTSEDCRLCDDCLRVGLRRIKQEVDAALGAAEAGADKDAELARLTQQLASIQHHVAEVNTLRSAGIPWYAWNHSAFLRAVALLWAYYMVPEPVFRERFGVEMVHNFWDKFRAMLDAWEKERQAR